MLLAILVLQKHVWGLFVYRNFASSGSQLCIHLSHCHNPRSSNLSIICLGQQKEFHKFPLLEQDHHNAHFFLFGNAINKVLNKNTIDLCPQSYLHSLLNWSTIQLCRTKMLKI